MDNFKTALLKMKEEIIDAISKMIKESNAELEKHITEINTLRFGNIEEKLKQHDKWHGEHFDEEKKIDNKITKSRDSIMKDVDARFKNNSGNIRSNISLIIAALAVLITLIINFWR